MSSTEQPEVAESPPPSSPSLSRSSTGHAPEAQPHRERRDSKLGHLVDSIRTALSQEQQRLFADTKAEHHHRKYQSTMNERLEKLREQDQTQRERVEEEILTDPECEVEESVSPAIQARERADLNENNMGPTSHEAVRRDSWGWPGLGTSYAAPAEEASTTKRRSSLKKTREKLKEELNHLEPKMEAATYEAIDNAAESESYGWPGLGDFPAAKK